MVQLVWAFALQNHSHIRHHPHIPTSLLAVCSSNSFWLCSGCTSCRVHQHDLLHDTAHLLLHAAWSFCLAARNAADGLLLPVCTFTGGRAPSWRL